MASRCEGRRRMKKFWTVRERLLTPWSIRAWDQEKSVPISALMASTVRSSTMAFTCCIIDPTKVRTRVTNTSRRYGLTKGRMFRKSCKRFIFANLSKNKLFCVYLHL